jgi:hypothetical protein
MRFRNAKIEAERQNILEQHAEKGIVLLLEWSICP